MSPKSPATTAAPLVPAGGDLDAVRDAAAACQACDLWKSGTQTVFGDGAPDADAMFVGEQPGDQEDRRGEPFVGPAGRILDDALESAGIARERAYVTNVVKHFKWKPRGKRRIHQRPSADEIVACRPWFEAEMGLVRPSVVIALGATAAQALLGRSFRVTQQRGEVIDWPDGPPWADSGVATRVTATVHPSSVLRAGQGDREAREEAMEGLVADLRIVCGLLPN